MNLNQLRFINWDNLLFSDPIDYSSLQRLINNEVNHLEHCTQTGLQLHLHQLINIIDSFVNPDRIVDVVTMRHEAFSDEQLIEIQTKATQLRILIECEKVYANQYWLNHRREWIVEIRILASLLRVYRFLERVWSFFVEGQPHIQNKRGTAKIILPLSKLEPFIDDVFSRLQKIEMCYYLHQFPYLAEIHVMFKEWRNLLVNFPTITRKEVVTDFNLRLVVLAENEKYKKTYKQRMLSIPESPRKLEKEKEKQKEVEKIKQMKKNKNDRKRPKSFDINALWKNKILANLKVKSKKCRSIQKQALLVKTQKRPTVRFPFQPIQLRRRSKNHSHFLLQRTISSVTSIRNPSESKSILPSKMSTADEYTNQLSSKLILTPRQTTTEKMSPTRIPMPRARRTELVVDVVRVVQERNPQLKVGDFEKHMREKEPIQYTFTKHHQNQFREHKQLILSSTLKLHEDLIQFSSSTTTKSYQQMQYQLDRIMKVKQVPAVLKPNRYFRLCTGNEQQI